MRLKRLGRGREPLPSLFDRHPAALIASRHPRGVQEVPIEKIVGTARHPTQNTADFLPLRALRGGNWEARWQRLQQATKGLVVLPPIELLAVGDAYWVVDGHNRVAAALRGGAAAIDADVTELLLPGIAAEGHGGAAQASLLGSEELRQAAEGRLSPTAEVRRDELSREELLRLVEEREEAAAERRGLEAAAEEPPLPDEDGA